MVLVASSSHSRPAPRRARSVRAPTGQTPMQRPQASQVLSSRGRWKAVAMWALKPRPA